MVNIQDDDSATTWGRGGSDEPSLPPIPPQQEVEESSESLPTSPLTQTLKVLSQNMDDLRYSDNTQHNSPCSPSSLSKNNSSSNETKKENSKTNPSPPESSNQPTKQTTATATTTTTTNRPYDANNPRHLLWKDYQDEWMRFNVYIPESAKLGLRIQSATFDYGCKNDDENATKDYCCHVLSSFGMAKEEYGLESGDWIAWPFENSSSSCHVELADFALAQAWAKQRPFHVCILRRRRRRREQTKDEEQQVPQQQDTATKTKTTSNPNNKPNDKSTFPTPRKDNDDNNNNNNNSLKRAAPNQAKSLSSSTITAPTSSNIRSSLEGRFMTRANLASSRILSQPKKSSLSAETTTAAVAAAGSQTSTKGSFSKSRTPTITPSKTSNNNNNNKKSHEKTATTSYQLKTTTKPRPSSPPPYCLKCNANTTGTMQRPRMHHAWCEHNEFYDDSGAQEIVQRIQHGIQVHCSVCQMEYHKGKLLVSSTSSLSQHQKYQHNPKCLQYQQRQRQQELQKKKKSLSPKKPRRNQDLNLSSSDSSSSSSDDEDEDDDDEVSCYKPQRKKSKIHVLSVSPPPRRTHNNNSMKRKSNNNTKKKKVPRRKPTKTTSTPKTKRPATTTTKVTPPTASSSSPNEEQQQQQQQHVVKSNWIACDENPWGPPGHQDGDVLLYGPQPGMFATTASARESLVVPKRYTLEPFAVSSPYRNTHYTPQEGFTMLSLRREPLARRPWGFQVVWDEFGHACLVESVDRLSPAAAASFVGESASTSSGLKVNDMILSINGKLVGGMTEDGVEIELETCGPSLLLVVSRYKHASLVQRKFVNVERRMLRAIDSAARDDRVLGWTEIGNAKTTTDPLDSNDEESSTSPPPPPGMQQHRRDIAIRSGAAVQRGVPQDDQESVCDVIGESRMENESAYSISSEAGPQTLEQDNNFGIQNRALDGSDSGRARQSNDLSNQYPDDDCTQDQNAWNGCVCGKLHTKTDGSDGIFWIQCESCQSWYDVSQNCVGFDMEQAKQTENWTCWACPSIAASTQASLSMYGGQNHAEPPQDSLNNDRCHDSMAALDPPHDQEPSTTPLSAAVMEEVKKKVHSVLRKRLRSDGTLLPRSKPKRLEDGTFQRPAGKPPKHFIWNFESGVWEIKGTNRGITQASPSMNSGQNHAEAPHDSQNNDRCHDSMAVLDPPDETTPPSAVVMEEVKKKIHSVLRKRLGSDGTLLPRSKPKRCEDGTFQRPAGKPPKHFKWNFESGVWVIKGSPKHVRAKQKPSRAARKGQDWKPPRTPPKVRSILPETPATDSLPSELIGKATGSFETGDLVYVKPHSWPGKNCQGGIGHIVEKPYENDEGIVCHTVRYAIGSLEKFIEAEYISPYSFR